MQMRFTDPGILSKLEQWATDTGRPPQELVEDVPAGYFDELAQVRPTLDSRYDDVKILRRGWTLMKSASLSLETSVIDTARRVVNKVPDAIDALVRFRHQGQPRTDLTSRPLRFWRELEYLVVPASQRFPPLVKPAVVTLTIQVES